MNENILITGGCGFVGSSLAINLKLKNPNSTVYVLDNLKRRGSELNIQRLKDLDIHFIHGDVRNPEDFEQFNAISLIIDAAAEPSVLSGMDTTPNYVLNTNLGGTINLLNFAKRNNSKLIFLSTSRVYPIKALNEIQHFESETRLNISPEQSINGVSVEGIDEQFDLSGARSFYGTSKLSSELLIQEYAEFYNIPAIINRCGVLTGPWQMGKIDQGVVVLWLAKHLWGGDLSYIGYGGKGKQVRDILHINDLSDLIDFQLDNFDKCKNQIFNVGGGNEMSLSLQEMTGICENLTGNKISISSISENRVADIPIYITNNHKINQLTNWSPKISPESAMLDVYNWMIQHEDQVKRILN